MPAKKFLYIRLCIKKTKDLTSRLCYQQFSLSLITYYHYMIFIISEVITILINLIQRRIFINLTIKCPLRDTFLHTLAYSLGYKACSDFFYARYKFKEIISELFR
jgi:hypothetical protein